LRARVDAEASQIPEHGAKPTTVDAPLLSQAKIPA
jgi:hypothetical protein